MKLDYHNDKKRVIALVDAFGNLFPFAGGGPAHIVIDDYNFADGHIEWCMDRLRACLGEDASEEAGKFVEEMHGYPDHSEDEHQATVYFLQMLLVIPEEIRD